MSPVFNKPADKQVPDTKSWILLQKLRRLMTLLGLRILPLIPAVLAKYSSLALIRASSLLLNNQSWHWGIIRYLGSSRAQLQLRQTLNAPEIKANVCQMNSFCYLIHYKPWIKMETCRFGQRYSKLGCHLQWFIFVKITDNQCSWVNSQICWKFNWETCKIGDRKEWNLLDL